MALRARRNCNLPPIPPRCRMSDTWCERFQSATYPSAAGKPLLVPGLLGAATGRQLALLPRYLLREPDHHPEKHNELNAEPVKTKRFADEQRGGRK
jgi:hypothetical protein